jgi:hypothetical protein
MEWIQSNILLPIEWIQSNLVLLFNITMKIALSKQVTFLFFAIAFNFNNKEPTYLAFLHVQNNFSNQTPKSKAERSIITPKKVYLLS